MMIWWIYNGQKSQLLQNYLQIKNNIFFQPIFTYWFVGYCDIFPIFQVFFDIHELNKRLQIHQSSQCGEWLTYSKFIAFLHVVIDKSC